MRVIKMYGKLNNQSGLTLVELSIAITLFGLIFVSAIAALQNQLSFQNERISRDRLHTLESVLKRYAVINGEYPRPAHRDFAPGETAHGQPAPLGEIIPCAANTAKACRIPGATPEENILVGALPVDVLSLPVELSVDGFGGQYTYAVTEHQTSNLNFRQTVGDASTPFRVAQFEGGGTITIRDQAGNPLEDADASAHFLIMSHGVNQEGTFTLAGQSGPSCTATGAQAENTNCDFSNQAFTNNATVIAGAFTSERNYDESREEYFDDYIVYASDTTEDIWSRSIMQDGSPSVDIFSRIAGNIFLGLSKEETQELNLPPPSARLAVQGDMKLEDSLTTGPARLYVDRLCEAKANIEPVVADNGSVIPGFVIDQATSQLQLWMMGYTRIDIDSPNYVISLRKDDPTAPLTLPRRNPDWSLDLAEADGPGGYLAGDVVPMGWDESHPDGTVNDDGQLYVDGVLYQEVTLRNGQIFTLPPGTITQDDYCDATEVTSSDLPKGVIRPSMFKVPNVAAFRRQRDGEGIHCDQSFIHALSGMARADELCGDIRYNGEAIDNSDCAGKIPVGTRDDGSLECITLTDWN